MSSVTIYTAPYGDSCRHSRELLAKAVYRHTGRDCGEISCNPWGKPHFPALPDIHCSVSHSGDWWVCAVSDQPVGLDLQIHRSYLPPKKLSARFFHPAEDRYLVQLDYAPFFDIWCAKESLVKYTGRGFACEPASFSVVSEQGDFPAFEDCEFRFLPFEDGYSLCLCAKKADDVRFTPL